MSKENTGALYILVCWVFFVMGALSILWENTICLIIPLIVTLFFTAMMGKSAGLFDPILELFSFGETHEL